MKKQDYKNHVKYYAPHHFVLLPLLLIAIVVSCRNIFKYPEQREFFIWITIVLMFIAYVAVMMRQHYALGNQNRIVRLEMRLRYYQLTSKRLEPLENELSFEQIAALRFAPDEQLPALLQKTVDEKLSAKDIKTSVQNWEPDYMRV
jgi:hypothetical protein